MRIYGAAEHGKKLIAALPSFEVKGIPRKKIIGNHKQPEIRNSLSMGDDQRMSYFNWN